MSTTTAPEPALDSPWLSDTQELAWRRLLFSHLHLHTRLSQAMAANSELTYPDYLILVALTDLQPNRARLFELTNALGWEKSRLSHQVQRMIDRGLLKRSPCKEDHRGTFVAPTARGLAALREAAPAHARLVKQIFMDRLSPEQLRVLATLPEVSSYDESDALSKDSNKEI
jgi:DNA-binding MarR family transcriptional regulator